MYHLKFEIRYYDAMFVNIPNKIEKFTEDNINHSNFVQKHILIKPR